MKNQERKIQKRVPLFMRKFLESKPIIAYLLGIVVSLKWKTLKQKYYVGMISKLATFAKFCEVMQALRGREVLARGKCTIIWRELARVHSKPREQEKAKLRRKFEKTKALPEMSVALETASRLLIAQAKNKRKRLTLV